MIKVKRAVKSVGTFIQAYENREVILAVCLRDNEWYNAYETRVSIYRLQAVGPAGAGVSLVVICRFMSLFSDSKGVEWEKGVEARAISRL